MAGFDGDAGTDFFCGSGAEPRGLKSKQIVAQVFAGVGDYRGLGGGVEQLYAEH
jgi:hypothetical protein